MIRGILNSLRVIIAYSLVIFHKKCIFLTICLIVIHKILFHFISRAEKQQITFRGHVHKKTAGITPCGL